MRAVDVGGKSPDCRHYLPKERPENEFAGFYA